MTSIMKVKKKKTWRRYCETAASHLKSKERGANSNNGTKVLRLLDESAHLFYLLPLLLALVQVSILASLLLLYCVFYFCLHFTFRV